MLKTLLLALIALGLWANVAVSMFRTPAASAEGQREVRETLQALQNDVLATKIGLDHLMMGNCFNDKICR